MRSTLLVITLVLLFYSQIRSQATDTFWIETFEKDALKDWHTNKGEITDVYNIRTDSTESFLSAESKNNDLFIIKECKVDLVQYPYLNFSWRAHELPERGNEYEKATCDIAASVYIVLKASRWRPRSIKFTWSTTLPENAYGKSPFSIWPARSDFNVVHTGDKDLGLWVHEKINVLEEYKKLYNKEEVKSLTIEAISIMTDSDNTNSSARADYDDIYLSKN